MASIQVKGPIPSDSDNYYRYLIWYENGERKQKYLGPADGKDDKRFKGKKLPEGLVISDVEGESIRKKKAAGGGLSQKRRLEKDKLESSASYEHIKDVGVWFGDEGYRKPENDGTYIVQLEGEDAEMPSKITYWSEEDSSNNREKLEGILRFNGEVTEEDAEITKRWMEEEYDTTTVDVYKNPDYGYYHLEFKISSPNMNRPKDHYKFLDEISGKYNRAISE